MEFNYSYVGDSSVSNSASGTQLSFAPDTLRPPTFFSGELRQSLPFREAISALHDVVVSDLRWHPKDKSAYKAWAARQEELALAEAVSQRREVSKQIAQVRAELEELRQRAERRTQPFLAARKKYFDYLFQRDKDAWFVLDPVITVHPDEVFFECFSKDEASYGRLGVGFDVFKKVKEFACGTTNIDYSSQLYDEFQKIRSYKTTRFEVDPSGFQVQTTGEAAHKEVKIDLPDSWVRGFLQVSSAMALPATTFALHPLDVHNLCFVLRRHKEILGPRSMRYRLEPGRPVKVVFDPWGYEVLCPRSVYEGDEATEVRVWGRRRIHILERLIPVARRFAVYLLGQGMPSFYLADLGDMTFTLGLSGWTTNDWSSAANFDLLAPRATVDDQTKQRVFAALKQSWVEAPEELARRLRLDRAVVLGALAAYTQAGRAMWDLNKRVYRLRELSREPLPIERLRFTNEREEQATKLLDAGAVRVAAATDLGEGPQGGTLLKGKVKKDAGRGGTYDPWLRLDADERIVEAECACNFFQQNRLRMGPCEHILALRLQHTRQRRHAKPSLERSANGARGGRGTEALQAGRRIADLAT
jgi:hypothetical protein